jgi:hypothetical protein
MSTVQLHTGFTARRPDHGHANVMERIMEDNSNVFLILNNQDKSLHKSSAASSSSIESIDCP